MCSIGAWAPGSPSHLVLTLGVCSSSAILQWHLNILARGLLQTSKKILRAGARGRARAIIINDWELACWLSLVYSWTKTMCSSRRTLSSPLWHLPTASTSIKRLAVPGITYTVHPSLPSFLPPLQQLLFLPTAPSLSLPLTLWLLATATDQSLYSFPLSPARLPLGGQLLLQSPLTQPFPFCHCSIFPQEFILHPLADVQWAWNSKSSMYFMTYTHAPQRFPFLSGSVSWHF